MKKNKLLFVWLLLSCCCGIFIGYSYAVGWKIAEEETDNKLSGDVTVKNFTNKKIESIMISREGQDFRYYGWLSPWINSGMHGFFSELPSVITLKWCYEDEEIYLQRRFNITHPELLKKYHDDFVGLSVYIVGKECMLLYFFSVYFPEGEFVNYVGFFPEENRWVDLIDFENEYRAIGRK